MEVHKSYLSLPLESPLFKSDVPIRIDHLDSNGGVIVAPKITIKRLTGSGIYFHGGDGHTQIEVEMEEATIDTIRVDGHLKVSKSLQADTLYTTKLDSKDDAQVNVKSHLQTEELSIFRHSHTTGGTIHINKALCMGDSHLSATTNLQINNLVAYCSTITSPSIRVNHGEINNRSIVKAVLQLRANVIFLGESSIECPDIYCNSLEFYRGSSIKPGDNASHYQYSKLVGNHFMIGSNVSMDAVDAKHIVMCGGILHARKELRCDKLKMSNGTVESPDIQADRVEFDGRFGVTTIICPGRMTVYENFECM
jgi:hypothetical protein